MKNLYLLFICLAVTISACHKTSIPRYPLSAALKANFGYKIGSYWVYRDSVSGETDSFYTYKSSFYTANEGDALVDRMDIFIKNFATNEIWTVLLIDSTFSIAFVNDNDVIQTQLNLNLFTYPFLLEQMIRYGEDDGYVVSVLTSFTINGLQFSNTIISSHKNFSNRIPLIIYNDAFYVDSYGGIVKVIFNHPQDSVFRTLELQRYNIVK